MRWLAVLALGGCAGQEPCSVADCAGWCQSGFPAAQEARLKTRDERTLTVAEFELFGPQLRDMRRGVRPFDAQSAGICAGTTTCERFIDVSVSKSLAPGDYVLHAALSVPRVGVWPAEFSLKCESDTEPPREVLLDEHRRYELRAPADGQPVVLTPLARFHSPSDRPKFCLWSLKPADGGAWMPIGGELLLP